MTHQINILKNIIIDIVSSKKYVFEHEKKKQMACVRVVHFLASAKKR